MSLKPARGWDPFGLRGPQGYHAILAVYIDFSALSLGGAEISKVVHLLVVCNCDCDTIDYTTFSFACAGGTLSRRS